MSQDEFTKLFNYMTQQFTDIRASLDDVRQELHQGIDSLHNRLDDLNAKADIDDTERLVMTKQLNQHEAWIEQVGEKLGVQYDHAG